MKETESTTSTMHLIKNLTLEEAVIWGPTGSICNGEIIEENTEDIFEIGQGIWPTDHKAVLVTFSFKK